jgi:hypothetical protein
MTLRRRLSPVLPFIGVYYDYRAGRKKVNSAFAQSSCIRYTKIMEELTVFCCTSGLIAGLATFFWARWSSRRVRMFSAVWMGPSIAVLSAVIFHVGTFVYQGLGDIKGIGLEAPTSSWSIFEWLRYTCISTVIPLVLAIVLLVVSVVVTGVGPHDAVSSLGGMDHFVTGAWLPDAFGCIALGSLILGPVPYGIFYGLWGFLLGTTSRLVGKGVETMQDPLALLSMAVLVWIASMVSALKSHPERRSTNS